MMKDLIQRQKNLLLTDMITYVERSIWDIIGEINSGTQIPVDDLNNMLTLKHNLEREIRRPSDVVLQ